MIIYKGYKLLIHKTYQPLPTFLFVNQVIKPRCLMTDYLLLTYLLTYLLMQ